MFMPNCDSVNLMLRESVALVSICISREVCLDQCARFTDKHVNFTKTYRMLHLVRWGGMSDLGGGLDSYAKMQLNLF